MDCLFCKFAKGEIPVNISHQDDNIIAFDDIHPQAPIHKLIVPRKHLATANDLMEEDNELIGSMFQMAKRIAKEQGIADGGYRLVMNCNAGAGQSVYHIHLHLLGGRQFNWPAG